jgi:hypothetical protein
MPTEVRSPWNSTGNEARRGESPGAYSSPSNARTRADGGHIAPHVGKAGPTNPKLRPDDGNLVFETKRDPFKAG